VGRNHFVGVPYKRFFTGFTCRAEEIVKTHKNKKGNIDRWIYMKDGVVYKREYDRNGDGKPICVSLKIMGALSVRNMTTILTVNSKKPKNHYSRKHWTNQDHKY